MVRIGGGVFPDIKEKDFLGEGGYRVDDKGGKVGACARVSWARLRDSEIMGTGVAACICCSCRMSTTAAACQQQRHLLPEASPICPV